MTETPQPPETPAPAPTPPAQAGGNGLAIAGMVLGIVSVVTSCAWYLGIPCGIVGLILSLSGKKKARQTGVGGGMAGAGVILSIIGIVVAVLVVVLVVAFGVTLFQRAKEMQEEAQRNQQAILLVARSFLA